MARLFHAFFNLGNFLSVICRRSFIKPPPPASLHGRWNDIPANVMELIAAKSGLADRLNLAAVCKSWASMTPEHLSNIKELPLFVLPHDPESPRLRCLNLSQGTVESLSLPETLRGGDFMGSTNGWLVFFKIEDNVKEALLFLFNPVSRRLMKLPPLPKTPCFHHWLSEEGSLYDYINSVVISSNLIKESTVIAATFCNGLELAMCKPGDDQWTIFTGNLDLKEYENAMERFLETQDDDDDIVFYIDILFHDNTLLVLVDLRTHGADQSSHPRNNRVYFLGSLKLVFINSYIDWGGDYRSESCSGCLIISNPIVGLFVGYLNLTISVHGELLLIVRWAAYTCREGESLYETTKKIDIFKIDINGDKEASRLEDIGNQVIFLSRIESRAMDSTSFSGIQGNCIYFAGSSSFQKREDGYFSYVCRDSGMYNLRDAKILRSFPSEVRSYSFQSDWFLPIY